MTRRSTGDASDVAVIVTPGSLAPWASLTCPRIEPSLVTCARAGPGSMPRRMATASAAIEMRRPFIAPASVSDVLSDMHDPELNKEPMRTKNSLVFRLVRCGAYCISYEDWRIHTFYSRLRAAALSVLYVPSGEANHALCFDHRRCSHRRLGSRTGPPTVNPTQSRSHR